MKNKASTSENLAIQAPWTSTMMKTWKTSVMRNPAIPSLAYHPHAFGHILLIFSVSFQFYRMSLAILCHLPIYPPIFHPLVFIYH